MRWFKHKGKNYTHEELLIIVHEILQNTLISVKIETIDWIHTYVPKRTGQLRNSLIDWVNNNWFVDEHGLWASMATDVEYATKITGLAAHHGTWYEHSGAPAYAKFGNKYYGRVYLDDPQAIAGWYQIIGSYIYDRFITTLQIYKENLLGG